MAQNLDFGSINVINAPLARQKLGISSLAGGAGLPVGGTAGQVLEKNSNANFDASWQTLPGGSPNLDGGIPSSTYGAISPINGGTP